MALTKLHDIEICIEDNQLKIIPYKLRIQHRDNLTPYFESDCSTEGQGPIFQCSISDKRNRDLVAYVLDSENWDEVRGSWDGYSEWNTTEYLTKGEAPSRIKTWLRKLPTYDLRLGPVL